VTNLGKDTLETVWKQAVYQDGMEKHVKPRFMQQNWRFVTLLSPILLPFL